MNTTDYIILAIWLWFVFGGGKLRFRRERQVIITVDAETMALIDAAEKTSDGKDRERLIEEALRAHVAARNRARVLESEVAA